MESHPLGSQAIAPLGTACILIVVAPPGPLVPEHIAAFRTSGRQGVNYRRGVWHHPLIALSRGGDFLIVDRAGEGENLVLEKLVQPLDVFARD